MPLGVPVSEAPIKPAIESKVQNLRLMKEKLTCLEPHQGLTLVKIFFSIPKLQYILRAYPAYKYGDTPHEIDEITRSTLSQITNVRIKEKFWSQASLPVRLGGLGLRQAVDVSLPAFVCSVHTTSSLVSALTSRVNGFAATTELVDAGTLWDDLSGGTERPTAESSPKQRSWDEHM